MNHMLNVSAQHYKNAHKWGRMHIKKPKKCVRCREKKPLDLSNNSGFYLLEINDWEYICRRCHILKDGQGQNLVALNKQRTSLTEEHKKKIGLANSVALKGREPWNKGRIGYAMPPSSEEKKEKLRKANKGQEPWNKGKKGVQIYSKERMEKVRAGLKGKPPWNKGLKLTAK
jgi:hypothetical protein